MTSPGELDAPRADADAPVRHSIWRPRGPVGDAARRSLRVRRITAALLLLALGVLFYLVLASPFEHPQLRIAAFTTVSSELDGDPNAALEAVPFAEHDLLAWRTMAADLSPGQDAHLLLDSATPYLAADLEALGGKLHSLSAGEQDVLLLYVRTQGVTRNGEPALLCSPQAAGVAAEAYPLTRLLAQLRALPQATKLLIVDAGADAVDFDSGTPVNEFPRLVADAVAETHDPHLWVLLSHGVLETSQVYWSRQRTALVDALTTGLSGAADANVDQVVDLDELFRFVSTSVARATVEISNGQATQTPQLCWGGGERPRGVVGPVIAPVAMTLSLPAVATSGDDQKAADAKQGQPDAQSTEQANPFAAISALAPVSVTPPVVSVSSASFAAPTLTLPSTPTAASLISAAATAATTPTAAAPPTTANAPAAAQPAAAAPTPQPSATPASAQGTKGDAGAPAADAPSESSSPPDANSEIATLLIQLWELRDRLQARGSPALTPIDAAPLEWRQLISEVHAFEFQYRSAAISDPELAVVDLRELVAALTSIAERRPRDGRRDPRSPTWSRIETNRALPALHVYSVALAAALAERGGPALSPASAAALSQLKTALQGTDRRAFDEWLKALPPELAGDAEFALAATLSTIPELPWPLLRDAMSARMDAERAAASWQPAPMVRNPTVAGDELRLAAERMLIDGVVGDRMNRAAALLQQARLQYDTALSNAALLRHASEVWHDVGFQAPDYIRWCTATGLATYRCGPSADDIEALLAGLLELGRRLQSATLDDRDAIQLQVGLLEQVVARIGPAECARLSSARRTPATSGETPWEAESLLTTSLPSAEHRLRLLQSITELESQRLTSASADPRGSPVPARTMSPRDWLFLETCTGFHVKLARLAVAGLPDANVLLSRLEQQWASAKTRQSTVLDSVNSQSDDDLFQIYRDMGVAFTRFRRDLSTDLEQSIRQLNQSGRIDDLQTRLELYDAVLHAQRLAAVDGTTAMQPALPLLRMQAAELLAWEAGRAQSRAVNADGDWAEHSRQTAALLRSMSGMLIGVDQLAIDTPDGLTVTAPAHVNLMDEEQTIEVTVAGQPASDGRLWVVLEYDPQLIAIDGPPGLPLYRESELAAEYARGAPATSVDTATLLAGPPLPGADGSFTGTWWTGRVIGELAPTWTLSERRPMSFALRIRRLQPASRPARLVIKAVTPQNYARSLVQFRTPAPAFADVQIEGISGAYGRDERGFVLHPFPNCDTGYRFQLVNLQSAARVVDVRLLALPRQLEFEIPAGTLTAGEAAVILERLRDATVAARLDQRPLPAPGAVVGGEPPAEPAPEEPEDPNKKPLPSLRHGGVVAIVDHATQETVFIPLRIEPQRPSRYVRPLVSYNLDRERVEIVVRGESADVMPPAGSSVRAEFREPLDETATFQLDGRLQAPQFETRLFADVQSAPGKVAHLKLHVDGYPRAFLYAIPCDRDTTSVPLTLDALAIELHRPASGTAVRTPIDGIPVTLELDAPLGAFESLPTTAEVGIDLNRDRFLVNEPSVHLQSDRAVDVRLKGLKPDGSLTLATTIGDFQINVPATGLGTLSANVVGRIQVGADVAWSEPRDIVLDGDPPTIESVKLHPGRELGSEQKLRVVVRADDRAQSGVTGVELTFDVLRTGEFAPMAKIIPAAEVGSVWIAEVPLDELAPGTWGLLIRAVDNVGNVSEPQRELVTILSAEAAAAKVLRATEPVVGITRYGEMPLSGIAIALKDDKEQVVAEGRSDADGRFELPRVKPGTYKISAQGLVKNKVRTAEAEVVVPVPPAAAESVRLQLK